MGLTPVLWPVDTWDPQGDGPAVESVLPLAMDWKGWHIHLTPSLLLSLLGRGQAFPTAGAAVLQAHKQKGGSVFTGVFLALP